MTVSIGQYIPGTSVFHRADPRTKILWTIAMMVLILVINSFIGYAVAVVFVTAVTVISGIPFRIVVKGLRPVLIFLLFTVVFNLLFYSGDTLLFKIGVIHIYLESIFFSIKMLLRIILLVSSASLLTYTTTSVTITDGLESLMKPLAKIGFPAHDIAMMMSIALRFIPTFADETDKIMKAQASRGAEFESGNVITKVKSYVPVLVPLFVGAFKRAEEMATAMEARCYRGGAGRTKYKVLAFGKADIIVTIITAVFTSATILIRIFV